MGALMREVDWSATPLGPVADWPQSLRTAVSICLGSRFPILVWWGPEFTMLYNDAYRPMLGAKHPRSMGAPGGQVWSEIWDIIGPMLDGVLKEGRATWSDDQLLPLHRSGYVEECYFTFSYSPIIEESGEIGGVFSAISETTDRVIGERRLELMRELADELATERTVESVCERAARILEGAALDLPFALLYLVSPDRTHALLQSAAGLEAGTSAAPLRIDLQHDGAAWPLASVFRTGEAGMVQDLTQWPGLALKGAGRGLPERASVLPIGALADAPVGFLVAGVSPQRVLDDQYAGFLRLVAGHIGTAIANARAYEAERLRAEALAQLDRAKTSFFSSVSHEFRTPLTLLLGPMEDALGREGLPQTVRSDLVVAHRNGLRLLKLVNTLLDFSRIEADRADASYEATDLSTLTADLASAFRSAVERAGLTLHVDAPALPEVAWVDRDMWEKIVLNLLSNAFKFTFDGGIRLSQRQVDGCIELVLADSGTGIPAEELPCLFERFHQVRGAQGRTQEGSGIGLSLVRELVTLHGGTIGVESEPGRGSTFTVRIPTGSAHLPADRISSRRTPSSTALGAAPYLEEAARWADDGVRSDGSGAPPTAAAETDGTILLADDNLDMREYVRSLLGSRWSVTAVSDGQQALESARAHPPDLVLSDVMMPRLDGFQLLTAIKADPGLRDIPVILLSARAGEESSIEGMQAGADDYLIKPFSARELVARVEAHVRLARLRREASRALAESENRLREFADTAPAMLWSCDPEARLTFISRGWYEHTGQTQAEAFGKDGFGWLDVVHPDDAARSAQTFREANQRREGFALEYRLRHADGTYRWAIDSGRPRFGGDGEFLGFVGSVFDVHQHKLAEARLREADRMQAVGTLAGGVAHEINNQMTAVLGFASFALRSIGPEHAQAPDLRQVLQAGERAANITQQLLAFSRRQVAQLQPVDLHALVVHLEPVLRQLLGSDKSFTLAPRRSHGLALADPVQVEQVLINLVANARDATETGDTVAIALEDVEISSRPSGRASGEAPQPGSYVRLTVDDTGHGMPEETLARAFEPFFTTKAVGRGTGLGLSMVYGIVRHHGGGITVESRPGGGTTVNLFWPATDQAPVMEDPTPDTPIADTSTPRRVVLLVEDEEMVRRLVTRALNSAGYRVLAAANGAEALRLLDQAALKPELVISDIVMPEMNGRQLGEAIAARHPGIPMLLISGYAGDDLLSRRLLPEGAPFLQKPFTPDQLIAAVGELVAGTP